MITSAIRALIFDMDGTLHDTERLYGKAWRLAGEELHVPDIESAILAGMGRNRRDMQAFWETTYPDISYERFMAIRDHYYFDMVKQDVPVKPGALELLRYLSENGYSIGLATSTAYDTAMDHLIRTGMDGYFHKNAVITGDRVRRGKPDPEIFLLAADAMGVDPAGCIGVEDSLNGIRAVANARMRPVMVPDSVSPTREIQALLWKQCKTLSDLIPILEAENGTI